MTVLDQMPTVNYFAKVRKRVAAALIDYIIVFMLTFVYVITFGHPNEEGVQSVQGVEALPVFGIWLIYFPIAEGLTGQTLGKKMLGTRVIKDNGQEIGFINSVVRRLFDTIDLMFFGLVSIIVMKSSSKRQRVGDLVAGTIVVDDEITACENCKVQLTLSEQEFSRGQFTCPNCSHRNFIIVQR